MLRHLDLWSSQTLAAIQSTWHICRRMSEELLYRLRGYSSSIILYGLRRCLLVPCILIPFLLHIIGSYFTAFGDKFSCMRSCLTIMGIASWWVIEIDCLQEDFPDLTAVGLAAYHTLLVFVQYHLFLFWCSPVSFCFMFWFVYRLLSCPSIQSLNVSCLLTKLLLFCMCLTFSSSWCLDFILLLIVIFWCIQDGVLYLDAGQLSYIHDSSSLLIVWNFCSNAATHWCTIAQSLLAYGVCRGTKVFCVSPYAHSPLDTCYQERKYDKALWYLICSYIENEFLWSDLQFALFFYAYYGSHFVDQVNYWSKYGNFQHYLWLKRSSLLVPWYNVEEFALYIGQGWRH